ncbi:MAG TPA: GAF domain-containing protein, partial [Verrucomicrobiae bacterium]|nr:GAF domain-containing protein [Verrucomicrobiae bacterium]
MPSKISGDLLARQLKNAHDRLYELFTRAHAGAEERPLQEALEELSNALEELRVTSETLRAQNTELAAARAEIEIQQRNYRDLFELAPDAYFVTDVAGIIQQANRKAAALLGVRQEFLPGKPMALFFPAERRPEYRSMLSELARDHGVGDHAFETDMVPPNAPRIPTAVTISVMRQTQTSGRRAVGLRWLVRDVSVRQRFEDQIKRHLQRLTVLGAINQAIISTLDLDTVMAVLFDRLQELFPYPIVATARLFHPETGELEPLFSRNIDDAEWKASGMRVPGPRADAAIHSREPLVIGDLATDPRTVRGEFYTKHGLASAMTVPLTLKDEVLGILSIYSKERREFTAEEIDLLASVGTQAAIAIQNSRLYEQVLKQSAALQAARGELEQKVEARTAQLAKTNEMLRAEIDERRRVEERLIESDRKLRALMQEQEQQLIASDRLVSVGELAASIAHEFNNPLQIIMGFAQ